MLPALYDDQRRALMRLALMLCCGSLAILPMTTQASFRAEAQEVGAAPIVRIPSIPERLSFPVISVRRDPFKPDVAASLLGRTDTPRGPGNAPSVRAIVLGPQSRALVDLGGRVVVLGVGDQLGASIISSIDATGVVLSNGVKLPLAQERQ